MNKYICYMLFSVFSVYGNYITTLTEFYNDHKKEIKMAIPIAVAAAIYLALPPVGYVVYKRYEQQKIYNLFYKNGIIPEKENGHYAQMVAFANVAKSHGIEGLKLQFKNKGDVDSFRVLCTANPGFIDSLASLAHVDTQDILSLRNNVILFDPTSDSDSD